MGKCLIRSDIYPSCITSLVGRGAKYQVGGAVYLGDRGIFVIWSYPGLL